LHFSTYRRGRTSHCSGYRPLTASGLIHDLNSMAFFRRQLPVISFIHTRFPALPVPNCKQLAPSSGL
jgi:hypothetical protein